MPRPQKGRGPDLVGDLTIGVQLQCVPGASQEHGTVFREDPQSSHTLCSDQTNDTLCMQLLLSLLQMFSLPKMPFPCILVGLDPRHVLVWLRCHLCHFAALNLFRQCGLHPLPSSATKHVPMLGHTLVLHQKCLLVSLILSEQFLLPTGLWPPRLCIITLQSLIIKALY